jgi:hypothetical protein
VLLTNARQALAAIGNQGSFLDLPRKPKPPALDQSETSTNLGKLASQHLMRLADFRNKFGFLLHACWQGAFFFGQGLI